MSLIFEIATESDDSELRQLLRENPVSGAISVTFECEPNYFQAAKIGGFHQALVGRDTETGAVAGMASRTVRPVFLNGSGQMVGYLSQFRSSPNRQWGLGLARILAKGFEFFQSIHADGRTPYYLISTIAGNPRALRLLSSGLPGFPVLNQYSHYYTYMIYPGRSKRRLALPSGLRLERGSPTRIPAILDCLQRNGRRYQFAPYWTAETLFSPEHTPDLKPEDFFLAMDGERIVGCLACWDQSRFKQTVVRGYAGMLGRWRKLINLSAPLGGWPVLPAPNTPWHYCYASHLAVDADDPVVFAALLRALYLDVRTRGYRYFLLGMSETHPLRNLVTGAYRHIAYASQLHLLAWQDGLQAISQIDNRPPGLEISLM